MAIHLPADLERFVREQVSSGNYSSEDDVVRAALERPRGQATLDTTGPGSIGAMRDDADLLEQVTNDVMESRRSRTLGRFAHALLTAFKRYRCDHTFSPWQRFCGPN